MFGGGMMGGGGGFGPGGARFGGTDGWDYEQIGSLTDWTLIKRMWPIVAPYRRRVFAAIGAMTFAAITEAAQPFIIGYGVQRALDGAEMRELLTIGGILLAFALVSGVARAFQQLWMAWVAHRLLFHLRNDLFGHMQRLSLSFYDKEEVGRVMSRVTSDVGQMQTLLSTGLVTVIQDIMMLVVIAVFMFFADIQLAFLTLVTAPVLIGVMAVWQKHAQQSFIRTRLAIAQVNSTINQNVSGVRVVQSLRREATNLREFDELNRRNREANLDAGRLQAIVMPVVEILSTISMILVVFAIGMRLFDGNLTASAAAGLAVTFTLYIQRFFTPIRLIVMQYAVLQRAMAGAHRVFELLDVEPEIVDAPDAVALPDIEGRVDFNHVWFSYLPEQWVLRDFDLHVKAGEAIAFVGHTGAGKTSVISTLTRFYDIQKGELLIDGHSVKDITIDSLRRRTSVVLQDPYLFSGSVAENIRYGRLDATDEEIVEAAKAVGAHEFVMRLEHGYQTNLHERGSNLSVGQRQLISFARALISDPRILILDEATANVDTRTEKVIQQALETMLQGRTSFVIAHRLSTIRNADRICVMRDGQIAEIGSHEELLEQDGVYADLFRMTWTQLGSEELARATSPN
ncbi:MAG: ATP-binding cassette domain-containing protein [Dehalococcoidia bacterium]|nr:ATP-binding cassette domain-containing protein [Dehalococcoidia bacterium]